LSIVGTVQEIARLYVRMVLPDGSIQVSIYSVMWPGASAQSATVYPLPVGAVTNATIRYTNTQQENGATYVSLYIARGQTLHAISITGQLIGGYLKPGKALSWPGGTITAWDIGPGFYRIVTLRLLGAGQEASVQLAVVTAWRLLWFHGTLTCSAVAATRFPTLRVEDGNGNLIARGPVLLTLAANTSAEVCYMINNGAVFTTVTPRYFGPLPDVGVLGFQSVVRTETTGMDAGDTWSGVTMWVEELIHPREDLLGL
jgi:hypothetical protein